MTKIAIPADLIRRAAEELGMIDPDQDEQVLHALDDYFLTMNDGQYSPLSGEHNNASNNTEVYHIARKHNVDPARMMQYLSDVALFDKFQQLSISEAPDTLGTMLEDFESKVTSIGVTEGKQRSVYEAHLMKFLEQIGADYEQGDGCVYVESTLIETMADRFPEFNGMLQPISESPTRKEITETCSAGATGAGSIASVGKPMGQMIKRDQSVYKEETTAGTEAMNFIRSMRSSPQFVEFHELQSTYSGYYAKVELTDGNIYDIEVSVSK